MQKKSPLPAEILSPLQKDLKNLHEHLLQSAHSKVPYLQTARAYLSRPGKKIRPALLLLFAKMSGTSPSSCQSLASAVELVHIASLIHDDVIDRATLRRGGPSLNQLLDNRRSVSLGDYFLSLALKEVLNHDNLTILKLFTKTLKEMCEGELLELSQEDQLPELLLRGTQARAQYLLTVEKKTASLFGLSAAFGCCAAKAPFKAALSFGRAFGMAFQMQDDALDYIGSEEELGKDTHLDLKEGKITLPLIEALASAPPEKREEMALLFPPRSASAVQKIADFVQEAKGIEGALGLAKRYLKKAQKILQTFPPSKSLDTLSLLTEHLLQRKA